MSDYFVDNCLAGKVAFVAGGSSGINLGIAARFAGKGAHVMLLSRTEEKLSAAAKSIADRGGSASWAAADVRDPQAVRAALERCYTEHGPIDILLSGAAGNFLAPATGLSSNGFKTVIDIDLLGTYNVLKHSYDFLRKPGASLISISAPQGEMAMSEQSHACAAKAGINMLTKVLAKEWGGEGIRVNAISPGFIAETEGTARLVDTDQKATALLDAIPLGRLGRKDEIADLAPLPQQRQRPVRHRRDLRLRRRLPPRHGVTPPPARRSGWNFPFPTSRFPFSGRSCRLLADINGTPAANTPFSARVAEPTTEMLHIFVIH